MAYLEILEVLDGSGSMQLFQKSKIQLNRRLLAKILFQCKGLTYALNLSGNELEGVRFVKGNPRIEYDISMQNDFLTMDYKENENVIPITADGSLLLRDNALYLPDARFMNTYLPFYSSLGEEKEPLVFEEGEFKSPNKEFKYEINEKDFDNKMNEMYLGYSPRMAVDLIQTIATHYQNLGTKIFNVA